MPDSKTVVKSGSEKSISPAVIKRLPRYYRYLGDLLKNNVVRISSKELSQRMNVTASQIRQDLNNFGGFGQQAGIIDSRKDEVLAGLAAAGLSVQEVKEKRGWECIICKKQPLRHLR